MAEARRMGKSELFSHFADRFEVKRTQAREFFDELNTLAEKELKRSGEFVLPYFVLWAVLGAGGSEPVMARADGPAETGRFARWTRSCSRSSRPRSSGR